MPFKVRTCLKPRSVVALCSPLFPSSLLLLTFLSSLHAVEDSAQLCTLYEPPAPGIHCLHGDQVLEALTESRWVWMLELYSSWCGHCQKFAPQLKELASELEVWSDFVRVGVVDCTASLNADKCTQLGVQAFPTIRVSMCMTGNLWLVHVMGVNGNMWRKTNHEFPVSLMEFS